MEGERATSSALAAQHAVLAELRDELEVAEGTHAGGRAVVAAAVRLLGAQAALLGVVRAHSYLEVVASHGYGRDLLERYGFMALDASTPAARVARTGAELWLSTPRAYAQAFPEFYGDIAKTSRTRAIAYAPLLAGGRSIGALGVGFGHDAEPTHGDAVMLRALAGYAVTWMVERDQKASHRRAI